MCPRFHPQARYTNGGWCISKSTSNCILGQLVDFFQGVLGHLVQDFGNSPTQISKFLGFGDTYGLTVPGTNQLCTRGLGHIQEDVKLHILLGGGVNPGGSWPFGAGVWKFPMGISKF
jgi:hypothetical protein